MNGQTLKSQRMLLRGFVFIVGSAGVCLCLLLASVAVVSSMGWGGRSDLQIGMIIVLLLLLPIYLSLTLTARALKAAQQGRRTAAISQAFLSLLLAPMSWSLVAVGLFAP